MFLSAKSNNNLSASSMMFSPDLSNFVLASNVNIPEILNTPFYIHFMYYLRII